MSARLNQFPKLNGEQARRGRMANAMPVRPVRSGAVLLACGGGALPEVATDVIDLAANYAVENVKRDRPNGRQAAGVGLGQWLERMLSSRAARP
ncbi:MAG: hypothetical protein FJ395_13300 [Verrucomicrobia bacterium]|nr:hypothetical protein [Verrucomicrobiota bacterium]